MIITSPAYRTFMPNRRVKPSHGMRLGMKVHVNVTGPKVFDYFRNVNVPLLDATRTHQKGVFGLSSKGSFGTGAGAEYNNITNGPALNGNLSIAFQLANTSGLEGAVMTVGVKYPSTNGIGIWFGGSSGSIKRNSTGATFLTTLPAVTNARWFVYTQTSAGAVNVYADGVTTPIASSTGNTLDTGNIDCIWFFKNTYLNGSQACNANFMVNHVAIWDRTLTPEQASEWVRDQQNLFQSNPYLKIIRAIGVEYDKSAAASFGLSNSATAAFDRASTNVSAFNLEPIATSNVARAVSASSDLTFGVSTRINVLAVSASNSINFGSASNNNQSFTATASNTFNLAGDAAGRNTIIRVSAVSDLGFATGESSGNEWARSISSAADFQATSSALNTTIAVSASSGIDFASIPYRSGLDWPVSASSDFVLSCTTDGGRAYSASAVSSLDLSVSISTNIFASSSMAFGSTAMAFRELGPASNSFSMRSSATAYVELPAGQNRIKNTSYAGLSKKFPVHFSETPSGLLLISDGIDSVLRWDGVSRNFIKAGIVAPASAPVIAASGAGSISGTYTSYVRFMDADGNVSNLSPISNSITASNAGSIDYTNVPVSTEGRVTRRQILRNTSGQATVYYVDVETTDLTSTSFSSDLADAELGTQEAVSLIDSNNNIIANLYAPPPSHKAVSCSHLSRMFLAAEVEYREGHVSVTNGSDVVQGVGTEFPETLAGRMLYVVGSGRAFEILSVDSVAQTLTLDADYDAPSSPFAQYAIRPAPSERKLIYYSESGLPEAWPATNTLAIQEDGDEITGLISQGSFLYIIERRHIYRYTFQADPATDGFVFPSVSRGSINQRCIVRVEDASYMLDEWGVHRFGGDEASESVSVPIQSIFRPGGDRNFGINWSGDTRLWHAAHSPTQDTIRWFVSMTGSREPRHAICLNYRQQRWWIEEYPWPITSSCVATIGYRRSLVGSDARRILAIDSGTLDGIEEAIGSLSGPVTSAGSCSLTVSGADFTTPGIVNAPVVISKGKGVGQSRRIVSVSGTTLYLDRPWIIRPDSTSRYQVGGVQWRWASKWMRYAEVEESNDRSIDLGFEPTDREAFASIQLFQNYDRAPIVMGYSRTQDGITITKGDSRVYVDLGRAGGVAKLIQEGHSDPSNVGRADTLSVELNGTQGEDRSSIYHIKINGAS